MPASSSTSVPFGVLLALLAGLYACRAREGDRCACAEDCGEGLACVAEGRVLAAGECTPVVGDNITPGVCVDDQEAGEDDGGGGVPEVFMDLGAKRDFDPGIPPAETETGTGTSSGTETGTSGSGTASSGTGSTGSTGTGSTGTGSTGTGSTGTGSTGMTSSGMSGSGSSGSSTGST